LSPNRIKPSPWFYAALVVQVALAVADVVIDETFTAVYLLPALALALVERARLVLVVAALAFVLAVVSGAWNENFFTFGHGLRIAIVGIGGALAVLSAQARTSFAGAQAEAAATGRRLDAILGSLAEAVTVHDADGRTVYANEAAVRLLGADSVDELLNAPSSELADRFIVTREDGTPVTLADYPGQRELAGKSAEPLLTRSVFRATGESFWYLTKATSLVDEHGRRLAVNVIEDVTEAKEAELRQRFLVEATRVLSSSLDYDETLERIAWLTVPTFADWCALDVIDGGELERVAVAHRDPGKLALGRELGERYPPDLEADAGLGAVIRSGQSEIYPEITEEMLAAGTRDAEHAELIAEIGMRSAMVVPMRASGATLGVLTFVNSQSGRSFDEDDRAWAEDLAARAATAVENARLYTRLTQTAETLQRSLLPARLEEPPGWRIRASYRAGERGSEVGGDFYDVFPVEGGWMVVLGDVTGKGVKAAALTALVRHTVKTGARFDPRPAEVMRLANDVLRDQPEMSIVTAVCAHLRETDRGVDAAVVSAGHPLPLRVGPERTVVPVGRHSLVLGAVDEGEWEESVTTLTPSDTLLFYTDGVTELPGETDRFGEQRLFEAIAAGPNGAADLIARLERRLDEFQASDRSDDRAMLAIEWIGAAKEVPAALSH
jgi:PAS domain S-box-containing protein